MRKEVSILAVPVRLPTKMNYKAKQATFMRFLLQVTGTPFKILDARQSEILTCTKILKHSFGNRLEFMSTNNKFRESLDNMICGYSPRTD